MGQSLACGVVKRSEIIQGNRYVIFQKNPPVEGRRRNPLPGYRMPIHEKARQERQENEAENPSLLGEEISIPANLSPVQAKVFSFPTVNSALRAVQKHWQEKGEALSREFGCFLNYLGTASPSVKRRNHAGLFGLFTGQERKPRLQSLHAVVLADGPADGVKIPILAGNVRAPWNREFTEAGQFSYRWGMEAAALVHGIERFFLKQPVYFADETTASLVVTPPFPVPPQTGPEALADFAAGSEKPELRSELGMFNIALEQITAEPWGIVNDHAVIATSISGEQSAAIVNRYHYWAERLLRSPDLH